MNEVWRQIRRLRGLPRGVYYAYSVGECPHERVKRNWESVYELGETGDWYQAYGYKCKQCGHEWTTESEPYND
jgi:hypothetical protein